MNKKLISTLLSVTVLGSIMAGCASNKSSEGEKNTGVVSGEKTKIRMAYWNNESTVSSLLSYLKEAAPDVDIEYQFIDNSNYNTIVDSQLSANEGPDLICESPASALKHAKLGYISDISDITKDFSQSGTGVYSYNNKTYALPGISWFEGIYINKELFEKNNIKLPTTFDEYIAVCKQFKQLGIKPLAAGLKSWEPLLKNSMAFVTAEYLSTPEGKNFGSDYREGKAKLDGTWNKHIEKWSETISAGVYTADMAGIDRDQALEEFATGKTAMFCSGPWDLETIKAKNSDLKIDMIPFYGTKKSDGWLIGGPGCGFAVNEKSKNKEATMKVLKAIATKEGQKSLWENNQGGSSYLNGVSFELPKEYTSISTTIKAGNVYCPWNEWGNAASANENYGTQMQSYLLGNQDISKTLSNVDSAVKELLDK